MAEIDREKVIKGLECHQSSYCVDCPYRKGWATCNAAETLFVDAIALLKEQEAVAIVWKFGFPHCPVCGQMLPEGDAVKYCLHCGQAVKWDA